jgi:peptidoglycan lytic transglycosylase G
MSDPRDPHEPFEPFDQEELRESPEPAGDELEDGAPEDEETRAERRAARAARVRRRRRIVAMVGGGLLVVILGLTLWYQLESAALGPEGPQVVVTVNQGEGFDSVLSSLSSHHVIGSSLAFRISNVFHGTPSVLPGSYALHENMSFADVRSQLAAGPNIFPVDVRPGFTLHEVAAQVDSLPGHAAGGFQAAASSGAVHSIFSPPGSNNLEGMLGTGNYLVLPGESDLTLVRQMVARFDHDATVAGLSTASAAAQGMTPYEVIIVASVVEKEGYYPKNMPNVARVIYNRLAQGMTLDMDSTVLYALGQDGGPVTAQDLKIQSPYNTYLTKGLPPTPICMPSTDALSAAVHPPPGAWLYFVLVSKDGTLAFSDTYAEQLANEQLAKSRGLP